MSLLITACGIVVGEECIGDCEESVPAKELQYLQKVTVKFPADVIVSTGDKNTYSIVGASRAIREMSIRFQGGNLTFSKKWYRFRPPLIDNVAIYITAKNLAAIHCEGRVAVSFQNFVGDKLWLQGSGRTVVTGSLTLQELNASFSGYVGAHLKGRVHVQEVSINGAGSYDASAMVTESMHINVEGDAIAQVAVTELLHASVSGKASLIYSGKPKDLQTSISGQGKIETQSTPQ